MEQKTQENNIQLNVDATPVLYCDFIHWNITPDGGVVLNFGQNIMGTKQVKVVSRVGMSREFAKKVLKEIAKNMALTEAQGQTGKVKS